MNFSYSDLLELLLKFGPKLPQAWEHIQEIIARAQALRELLSNGQPAPVFAAEQPPQSYEIELESKVIAAFNGVPAGAYGAPEFPRLREVFQFLKAHPELIKLLLALLAL